MAKKPKPPRGPQLELAGDLGVVNTAGEKEWNFQQGFRSYAELLIWGQQAGVVDTAVAERLRRLAAERPEDAEAVAARAVELRSSLFSVFVAIAGEREPAVADLEALNASLTEALPALRVVPGESGLTWGWGGDEDALDRVLWAVARSAAELLISLEGRPHVRQCARKGCTLWFVSRTSRRKWCGDVCRNRAKALRYYYLHARERRDRTKRNLGVWKAKRPRKKTYS
ncbi:MAG: ABATE domain-containing protein [Thermoanaerobaculia bacterium]